jgi:uncharacterized membrane protein
MRLISGTRRLCNVLLLLLALSLFGVSQVSPGSRSYKISDFTADIEVHEDGSADILERITFVFFGEYHGIRRYIPVDYPGPDLTNYKLMLKVRNVTDENGKKLDYDVSSKDHYRVIKVMLPGAIDTDKKVFISYHVRNAVKFFDDHDEFYWNVTGNGWSVPIDSATALVRMPAAATGQLRAHGYVGLYGSNDKAATEIQGSNVSVATPNVLSAREGLTVDVYVPRGILRQPSSLTRAWWFVVGNPIIFLPVLSFAVMFAIWWRWGKDPDPGASVAPMYNPPKDMTPAEVGTLIDDTVDARDITAIIVDLAVRGYLKITEVEQTHLLMFKKKDYLFENLKDPAEWNQLAAFERTMLENLFAFGGKQVHLSDLRNRFYTAIPAIKGGIISALKTKGMYTIDPESAGFYWILGAVAIGIPLFILYKLFHVEFFNSDWLTFVCIGASALIVFLFSRLMTAKSQLGARTLVQIQGFQEFMNRVDSDRLKRMPPDTFEKYLPFAMALGVEHRWAKAFAGIVQNPPTWYVSPYGGMFNSYAFVHSMNDMTSFASETFTSAPRASSSSSGFSGGGDSGFSGGGFGGGGGDAF